MSQNTPSAAPGNGNEQTAESLKQNELQTQLKTLLDGNSELNKDIVTLFDKMSEEMKKRVGLTDVSSYFDVQTEKLIEAKGDPTKILEIKQKTTKWLFDLLLWDADTRKGSEAINDEYRTKIAELKGKYEKESKDIKANTSKDVSSLQNDLNTLGDKYDRVSGLPDGIEARKKTFTFDDNTKREIIRIIDKNTGLILHTIPLNTDGDPVGMNKDDKVLKEYTYVMSGVPYKIHRNGKGFEFKDVSVPLKKKGNTAAKNVKPATAATGNQEATPELVKPAPSVVATKPAAPTTPPKAQDTLSNITPVKKSPEKLAIQGDMYDIGVQVFEKLRKPGESISFSPTSLQQVLYVYTLSRGNEDLANKLGFAGNDKAKFETLLKTLNAPDAAPFKSVNAVFSKLGNFGNEKLLKNLKVELGKINPNDIAGETARLNKFVSDQTNGMIKDLFKTSDVSSAQEIFVNTMYFKGDWESTFNSAKPDQKFGDKKADLMTQTSNFEQVKTERSQVIKMPFKDGSSMIAFLPDSDLSVTIKEANQLLKNPNSIRFGQSSKVKLTFPKFETESTADGIGVKLGIDVDVIQKSKVTVDETGAKAAAASGVNMRSVSVDPELKFDKPFYYAIQDKTGNVHFIGTYEGK